MSITRVSTTCYKCGQVITDESFKNLTDALNNHWEVGACRRDEKIREVLGEEPLPPNAQEFYRKDFDYNDFLERCKKNKSNG